MGDVFDFESARHRKTHERKEARVRKLRKAFRAARQSGEDKPGGTAGGLARLLKRKKTRKKK